MLIDVTKYINLYTRCNPELRELKINPSLISKVDYIPPKDPNFFKEKGHIMPQEECAEFVHIWFCGEEHGLRLYMTHEEFDEVVGQHI